MQNRINIGLLLALTLSACSATTSSDRPTQAAASGFGIDGKDSRPLLPEQLPMPRPGENRYLGTRARPSEFYAYAKAGLDAAESDARLGVASAQAAMGYLTLRQSSSNSQRSAARAWFDLAYSQGHPEGIAGIGVILEADARSMDDLARSRDLYEEASRRGSLLGAWLQQHLATSAMQSIAGIAAQREANVSSVPNPFVGSAVPTNASRQSTKSIHKSTIGRPRTQRPNAVAKSSTNGKSGQIEVDCRGDASQMTVTSTLDGIRVLCPPRPSPEATVQPQSPFANGHHVPQRAILPATATVPRDPVAPRGSNTGDTLERRPDPGADSRSHSDGDDPLIAPIPATTTEPAANTGASTPSGPTRLTPGVG